MVGSEVGKIGGSFSTEGGKLFLEGLLFLPACSFELPCFCMVKTSCKTVTHLIINNCRSQSDPLPWKHAGGGWGKWQLPPHLQEDEGWKMIVGF